MIGRECICGSRLIEVDGHLICERYLEGIKYYLERVKDKMVEQNVIL
jgi:hypothetical protein